MDKLETIKRNTLEILTQDELKLLLKKPRISAYYGTAPTGPVHIGYFATLSKIFDLQKAGVKTILLIADIHAALDDLKCKWDEIELKSEYYKKCFELSFAWEQKPKFVRGSSFQWDKEYQKDVLKASTFTTVKRATRAASEVTRMKNPKVSELIYPIMQALDEEYLKVDIQLGGIDQRHIFALNRELLPRLGYKKRVEIMMPLMVSLKGPGTKMSATNAEAHIKPYDSEETIIKKIRKAYCPEGVAHENPVLGICKFIIFPGTGKLVVERAKKFGGELSFKSYEELEKTFVSKQLHPSDLKDTVAKELCEILKPARSYFEKNNDMLKQLGKEFLP
jgi:tyrosyl-tRNA synthetase